MIRTFKASLLFSSLSLCAVAIFVTERVRREVSLPAPHALFAVVEEQLAALRVEDYSSVFRHAASGVQQKFTMPQFETMIRRDFGDMTGTQRIEFGSVKIVGVEAVVQVFFVGESGSVRSFLYSLIAEGDLWKINGVQQVRSARPGNLSAGLQI